MRLHLHDDTEQQSLWRRKYKLLYSKTFLEAVKSSLHDNLREGSSEGLLRRAVTETDADC